MTILHVALGAILACLAAPGVAGSPAPASTPSAQPSDMATIMTMLARHDKIRFVATPIRRGERTVTTSADPEVARAIRRHARDMQARLKQNNNIRPNDPIFIEIFRHREEIHDVITDVPGGVSEDETSRNPQVVLLIRAHARSVAEFVREGVAATHHNTPLPKGYRVPAP